MIVKIGLFVTALVISILAFILGCWEREEPTSRKKISRLSTFLKKSNIKAFNYDTTEELLKKNGIMDKLPFINPNNYQICRILMGVILGLLGNVLLKELDFSQPWLAFLLIPVGFPFTDRIVKELNEQDNEKMLPDIRKIYNTLKIQSKAGMYLTESLLEIYRVVTNKRLKKALLELNGNLYIKNQITEAIDDFNSKFNNDYIDMMCTTITQAEQSGQSVKILNDISGQLVAVQKQMHKKEENRLEGKLVILQLLLAITIILIIVIILYSVLMTSINF